MFLTSVLAVDERDLHVTTGFEDWCEQQGVYPEAFGAWESFQLNSPRVRASVLHWPQELRDRSDPVLPHFRDPLRSNSPSHPTCAQTRHGAAP
jgi:hypothetical protein